MIPGPKVQGTCLAAPSSASPADAVKTGKATIPYGQDGLPSPLHGPAEPADGPCHPPQARPRLLEVDALGRPLHKAGKQVAPVRLVSALGQLTGTGRWRLADEAGIP